MSSKEPIKLMRSPINTNCESCKEQILFGVYAYFDSETNSAMCIECGVKRGWTDKSRVKQIVSLLELREDVRSLKGEKKEVAESLQRMKQQFNLFKLGEHDLELEKEIIKLMDMAKEYCKR